MSDEASPGETWHIDHDTTTQRQASGEPRSTRTLATELVAMAREQYQIVRGTDAQVYAVARTNPGVAIPLRGSRDGLRQQLAAAYFDQRGRLPPPSRWRTCSTSSRVTLYARTQRRSTYA